MKPIHWLLLIFGLVYFTAIRVDVMDVDAAQYAEISREMNQTHQFLQVYDRGDDYLDKPPFLFWVSALSMSILGTGNFGYKLPSILFALLAIYATYCYVKVTNKEKVALRAAAILASSQGLFLMTNDIRTDTILMATTISSILFFKKWDLGFGRIHFFIACTFVAIGLMTKGPIALVVPILAFASEWLTKRDLGKFLQPIFLIGVIYILLLLTPMLYGLYQQFDLHPEKIIGGKQGVSGLKFFFWTQSFGRITGENDWNNHAPFSFLYENMLWSFLPWVFILTVALSKKIVSFFRIQKHQTDWVIFGGFIFTYCILASSKYQLPHYIFIAFPFASIIVSNYLDEIDINSKTGKTLGIIQNIVIIAMLIGLGLVVFWVFPATTLNKVIYIFGGILVIYLIYIKYDLIKTACFAMLFINLLLTNHFYVHLVNDYQLGSQLGKWLKTNNIKSSEVVMYHLDDPANSLHFYAQEKIKRNDSLEKVQSIPYLITSDMGKKQLEFNQVKYKIIFKGHFFKVSELTPVFINPKTRKLTLKNYYLLKL